jgi:RecG-like helicase
MSGLRRRTGREPGPPPNEHEPNRTVASIATAPARRRCTIEGAITRMRARPSTGVPALVVTIADDSGSITAVWTGRRAIGGITLGRRVRIEGVGRTVGSRLEFVNPDYTLLP